MTKVHCALAFGVVLLWVETGLPQTETERQAGKLQLHVPVERELGPGLVDVFTVDVAKGQFAHVVAEQKGVDVVVTIMGPEGKVLVTADSPNYTLGPEPASWIAQDSGLYQVRVSKAARTSESGRYQMELSDLREPGEADHTRIEAESTFYAAMVNDESRDKNKLAAAVEGLDRAASLWRELKDGYEEALCLYGIGRAQSFLGERQKALDYYERALVPLHAQGDRYAALGEKRKALDYYQQVLVALDALGDRLREDRMLNVIGNLYSALGEKRKAVEYYERVLPLRRARGNQRGEAEMLNVIGDVYSALGEKGKALDYYEQVLPLRRELGNRMVEAKLLNSMGIVCSDLGEKQKALDYFGQAQALFRATGVRAGEADTLDNIGVVYSDLGEKEKALDYFGQTLALHRALGDRPSEAATLNNIGAAYADLGEKQKALDYYGLALPLRRAVGDRAGEATTLTGIGNVYSALGEKQKALDYYGQALPLRRAVGDRAGEAGTLTSIGHVYSDLGEKQKALDYFEQALPLIRAAGVRSGEAATLTSIGNVYSDLGEKQKALDYYGRALPIFRAVGDRTGEAATLTGFGYVCSSLGEKQKALDYYGQALPLFRAVGDREREAATLVLISLVSKDLARPEAAIWFGKQAVNVLQSIRRDNQKLPDDLKRSYETSIGYSYRTLAGLLVEGERFGEAEEVLNLLKDKEASDFILRDKVADILRPVTVEPNEREALKRYEEIVDQLVTVGGQLSALEAKKDKGALSGADAEQEARLNKDLDAANAALQRFLQEVGKSLASDSATAKSVDKTPDETAGVQDALRQMDRDVVAIYTLVLPDRYIAILITSGTRKAYTTTIKEADLNQKIFNFRRLLESPSTNPLPQAQELYRIVFPEGLRQDLDALHAKTIMWSIDSTLRYVPIAALHDGQDYLVKQYRNSLITPAFLARLTEPSASVWRGTGFGVSEAKGDFANLPSVELELHSIFRQKDTDRAPVAGRYFLNADFTLAALLNLRNGGNGVVHIATHFDSRPGVAENSRLLLGDGSQVSLADIQAKQGLFRGVDLLTLSACSTAFTNKSEDGREVDSFGTIAQRLGAKGVIASLWSVNDEATARLMEAMYRLRQENPGAGKSEALRLAQEQMASGVLRAGSETEPDARGVKTPRAKEAVAKDWSHPFYWAPFILIGNWK